MKKYKSKMGIFPRRYVFEIMLLLVGMTAGSAWGNCKADHRLVWLNLQPDGVIKRDISSGRRLSHYSVTTLVTCDNSKLPTIIPNSGDAWVYSLSAKNSDYGPGVTGKNRLTRLTSYEGIELYWVHHSPAASHVTPTKFPLNNASAFTREFKEATGIVVFRDDFELRASPHIKPGEFKGFSVTLSVKRKLNGQDEHDLVTFVIKPFTVKVAACSVGQSIIPVPMGRVSAQKYFNSTQRFSDKVPFTIRLECDAGTNVSISFDGATVPGRDNILALNDPNDSKTATGVGVQLINLERNPNNNNGMRLKHNHTIRNNTEAGTQNLQFAARYYQTARNVTGGVANATATFTLTYR
ncbi:MAG: fimbrial protein [Yersinia sp. (in: enterobacteria)]